MTDATMMVSANSAHQQAGVEQHEARAGIVDGAELELEARAEHEHAERKPISPPHSSELLSRSLTWLRS